MKKSLKFAFITDIPVILGYVTMGIAFGLMLEAAGYNFVWAFCIAAITLSGTIQFLLVSMLSGGFNIVSAILMTLSVNSRYMFYGLSFLKEFKAMGKAYPYMIFSLTDETYALLCGVRIPEELNKHRTMVLIAAINHAAWVFGCTTGAAVGQLIKFNTEGVDFAMTALFVVLFVDQWIERSVHLPALVGIGCGILSLIIVGPDNFIIPAILSGIALLLLFRKPVEKKTKQKEEEKAIKEALERAKEEAEEKLKEEPDIGKLTQEKTLIEIDAKLDIDIETEKTIEEEKAKEGEKA